MSEIFDKMKTRLIADAGNDVGKRRTVDFVIWLIESGNHEDKATEIVNVNDKKSVFDKLWTSITDRARKAAVNGCACVEEKDVYMWAVEFFKLEACITRKEIADYCAGKLHANAENEKPDPDLHANTKNTPFSVDIDSLFDD